MKLIYFSSPGRAGPIRLALHIGAVEYEFVGLSREEFNAMKSAGRFPFGKVPVVETADGRTLAESRAILRWVGKKVGLYPEDSWEAAKVEELLSMECESVDKILQLIFEPASDEEVKKSREQQMADTFRTFLQQLTSLLNQTGSGFLCTQELSIADLQILPVLNWLGYTSGGSPHPDLPKIFEEEVEVKALCDRLMKMPEIEEYYRTVEKKKPETSNGNSGDVEDAPQQ